MAVDLRTRIIVSRESRTSLPSAVVNAHDGQAIVVRAGTFGWRGRLAVRRGELHGERIVDVVGEDSVDFAMGAAGQRLQVGSQLIGQWDCREGAFGRMRKVTLFHNATRVPDPSEDGYELEQSATVHLTSGTWMFEQCQLRSIAGVAVGCVGEGGVVGVTECKVGGMGEGAYRSVSGLLASGNTQLSVNATLFEFSTHSGLYADEQGQIFVHGSQFTSVQSAIAMCHFAAVLFSEVTAEVEHFCFVVEGGIDYAEYELEQEEIEELQRKGGKIENKTTLVLHNCAIKGNMFDGYGRPGQLQMENTTFSGVEDATEIHRRRYQEALRRRRANAVGRGADPNEACEDPDLVTPQRYKEIQCEVYEVVCQALREQMAIQEQEELAAETQRY